MSTKIDFVKGEFQQFRVTTQVHLGRLERNLEKGDIIDFDGHTLKFEGSDHNLPQLRGAVLQGWLVPASDTTTVYKAKSANIKIRPAQAANINDRGKAMRVERAIDDNRVVGSISKKADTVTDNEGDDGQTIAKIATPARQRTKITDASAAQSAINALDNAPPPSVKKLTKVATGDVEDAIVAEALEDILPDAAVTPTPTNKAATNKPLTTDAKTKIVTLDNGIEWDMGRHWRTRGRDATRTYGEDAETLSLIKQVEVPSVNKMIEKRLSQP